VRKQRLFKGMPPRKRVSQIAVWYKASALCFVCGIHKTPRDPSIDKPLVAATLCTAWAASTTSWLMTFVLLPNVRATDSFLADQRRTRELRVVRSWKL
jgi:hypothetical protein